MTDEETRRWMERIESRLGSLEGGRPDDKKVVMDERTEIEAEGSLGGVETAKENGSVVKTRRVPTCDFCGDKLEDKFAVCQKCGKKLCSKCAVKFRNQKVCPQDLRSALPLSRTSFKVLLLIANNIQDTGDIRELSRISKDEIGKCREFISNAGYTETRGLLRTAATELGLEALTCYGQLFGGDPDMLELDQEVREFVLGRK